MTKDELLSVVRYCDITDGNSLKLMTSIAWINCLLQGKSPFERLHREGINEIIVYGITELGELLVQEALNEGYRIVGITDKRVIEGQYIFQNIPVLTRHELKNYREVNIVVTSVTFWEEIKHELCELGCNNIISLWELM